MEFFLIEKKLLLPYSMDSIATPPSPPRTTNTVCPGAPSKPPKFRCQEIGCNFICNTSFLWHLHEKRHLYESGNKASGGGSPKPE